MIRQTEHLSIYVFSATQILSRRPTFSNGLINTNRPVYITDNSSGRCRFNEAVDSITCARLDVYEY